MSETDGMDNPAFTIEEDCAASAKVHDGQQQVTLDQDHKPASEGGPMENGHQRSFVSQQYVEPGRTSPDPRYKTETRIELPESNERTVVEPKLNGNGVHGNGNNNDASFLNSSATSVQMNDTGKKEQIEAVNLELVSMRPYAGNNHQTKGQEACEVPADPYEEYFVPVNEHRKYIRGPEAEVETTVAGVRFDLGPGVGREGLSLRDPAAGLVDYSHWLTALRGEKLYVTKDKRSRSSYWRRMACWGCGLLVLLVAIIIAILAATGVILAQEASEPLENLQQTNSRQFGDVQTAGSQEYIKNPPPSPPPATSSFPPWPTTDESMYNSVSSALNGLLQLDDLHWSNDLHDHKSRVYRQVASEIEEHLTNMLRYTENETIVKVYEIGKEGDVKFRISYPPRPAPQEVQQMIEETLRKGGNMIGRYHLRKLRVSILLDECQIENHGCAEVCKYDYAEAVFVCSCNSGKTLDKDGKRCVDKNDLSNVDMDDEPPESNTEAVHDYVQGRSRGPGSESEPRRPDNWDHLDFTTQVAHVRHDSSQDDRQTFYMHPQSDYEAKATPVTTTERNHALSDDPESVHWMHDYSGHVDAEPKAEPTSEPAKPAPTSEPEPSAEPEPSVEPEPSAEPEPSVEPEPSAEPEPSVEPSAEPEPSVSPGPSAELEPSAEPGASVEPEPSAEPGASAELEPSAEPGASVEPEPSAEPGASVEPEPSAEPGASVEPQPSATTKSPAEAVPSAEPEPGISATPEPSAEPEPGTSATPEPSAETEPSAEPITDLPPLVELKPSAEPQPPSEADVSDESKTTVHPQSLTTEPSAEPVASTEASIDSKPPTESVSSVEGEPATEWKSSSEPESSTEYKLLTLPPTKSDSIETKPEQNILEVSREMKHSTEMQHSMGTMSSTEQPSSKSDSSTESMTTNNVFVGITESPPTESPQASIATSMLEDEGANTLQSNVSTSMEPETTTLPNTFEETTLMSNEMPTEGPLGDDAPLPVIPLMVDDEESKNHLSADQSEMSTTPVIDTTMKEINDEEEKVTENPMGLDKQETPKVEQATEAGVMRDGVTEHDESGNTDPSTESGSMTLSGTKSTVLEVESTTHSNVDSETTTLFVDTLPENATDISSTAEGSATTSEEPKSQNASALPEDTTESSVVHSELSAHDSNETNIIEHTSTTLFPKLPKNFGHNIEPVVLESLKNKTEEEHIMVIPKTDHISELEKLQGIIPQLIPEQSIHPANATISEGTTAGSKAGSSTERIGTILHHSTTHPEENIVSVGDSGYSGRYDDNLDQSTNHPLHPAGYPENAVTEKPDMTYDKHVDDMSPFLPDVQREKEVKKAPRLDKDEQDVPNPFEGPVEDVVTYKPVTENATPSTEHSVNETAPKESINDVHPEMHDSKPLIEQEGASKKVNHTDRKNEVAGGIGKEALDAVESNDTEAGDQNGLHTYDVVNKPDSSGEVMKESEGGNVPEEDEEALKVVPLEAQFKETETTIKYDIDKDKSEVSTEASATSMPTMDVAEKHLEGPAASNATTSEKPEENAVEDLYNDINDDTLSKGYQHDDTEIHKAIKKPSKLSDLDPTQNKDGESLKSTGMLNDTEVATTTMGSVPDKHVEDAKLTTQIPVLPMEIQQEMSTTEKFESTTVTEESPRKDNDTNLVEKEDTTTVQTPTTHAASMDTKTTAQVPILPEELQTTESDSLLTTSSVKPDAERTSNDTENVDAVEMLGEKEPSTFVNKTEDSVNSSIEQVHLHDNKTDDLLTSALEHVGGRNMNISWPQAVIPLVSTANTSQENVTTPLTMNDEENTQKKMEVVNETVTEAPVSEPTLPVYIEDVVTTEKSAFQEPSSSSTTEDVRPVTEILEDDTQPAGFDYKIHLITTTPKAVLPDLDVGELSEEDLRVIPLEKTLEVKKKSTDKKVTDKYKYKKEKELNLEGNEENVATEVPDPTTLVSTEIHVATESTPKEAHNVTEVPESPSPDATENSAQVPKVKIIDTTGGSNQTEPRLVDVSSIEGNTSTKSDSAKKYPSFIPVSEEIIEPEHVTEPFVVFRNYHLRRQNTDDEFATENPSIVSEPTNERHAMIDPGKIAALDETKANRTGSQPPAFPQSSVTSLGQETGVNQPAREQNVATTVPRPTKSPDTVVETTSHIDVPFPRLPPNIVYSKCTAGQFQCTNGTSRDGAYCVKRSAQCDSENDCSDGSDELNCEEDGCPGNFQCASGQCLKRDLVCNRIVDCDDGSDERNCDEWKCQFDEFKCPNGRCIPGIWQCDGRPDCEDHRDEYNCAKICGNDEYLCPTENWCIPLTWHCNGISECANGEDEKLCGCALDQFKCQTGGCVPENQVCDGIEHCPDHSDEWGCLITNMTAERNFTDLHKESEAGNNGAHGVIETTSLLKIRQFDGSHRLVCSDAWSGEFSESYCQALGFAGAEATELTKWDRQQKILRLKSNPNHRMPLVTNLEPVEFCVSEKVVQISCQEFSCGSHYGEGPTARLVGGTSASEGQWSSVVLLKEPKYGAACTASVVGPMHVLSSYSCIHRYKQSNGWQLFTGENLLKAHPVRNIIPYPQVKYNQFLYNNDIALVQLEKPLTFSRNVSAVCLPQHPIQPRQICVTVGWGFPVNGEVDLQKYLKFLPLPTYDSEKCNGTSHYAGFITKDNICAGFTDTDKGPCYNDEGAPLMCGSESGGESARWEIQGLLSHHSRCSRGHPAIYSSVEPALSWLRHSVPALQMES